jgi:hypothetical protein
MEINHSMKPLKLSEKYEETVTDYRGKRLTVLWPKQVTVLTIESFTIWPNTKTMNDVIVKIAETNFLSRYNFKKNSLKHTLNSLVVWFSTYEKVVNYLKIAEMWTNKPQEYVLAYNTTWALLGYTENQQKNAVDLAITINQNNKGINENVFQ